MAERRPLILVTNDDGVRGHGIGALSEAMRLLGDVVVVAPTHEQSGSSHAITIDRPLRHIEYRDDVHSVDGTPADCIYIALAEERFLPRRPDLVVSGINNGANVGSSVFYSGTIAGAREAALRGIPAIAFSQQWNAGRGLGTDFRVAARYAGEMVERFLATTPPPGQTPLLNVNIPASDSPRGVRVTRVGSHIYEEAVVARRDPGGREYFWIGGRARTEDDVDNSDTQALAEGFVSVTALQLEATKADHIALAALVGGSQQQN